MRMKFTRYMLAFGLGAAVFIGQVPAGSLNAVAQAAQSQKDVPVSQMQMQLSFAPLVKQAAPAVVNIYTKKVVEQREKRGLFNDPFFKRFFGDRFNFGRSRKKVENSLGSGVIVRKDGVIVTNNHVIKGASEIRVVMADRREMDAEIILADERTDLAVLRVLDPKGDLPALRFGDSDNLEVGDLVLAIGNPFGVGQTVTSGIVSGLARTAVNVSDFRSFIQTDAAINPGNSGGALMNMSGEVVGINTAIFSRTGGSVGIGFAVPATMVSAVVDSALTGKPLQRPWLGFAGRDVTSEIAEALGMDRPGGIIVEEIFEDSPADNAGLRPGDVITAVEGYEVEDAQVFRFRLATRGIGGTADVGIIRAGTPEIVKFNLIAAPEIPARDELIAQGGSPLAGTKLLNLSPAVAEELGMADNLTGVVVAAVAKRSPAARFGLRPRDRILAINGTDMENTKDIREAIEYGEGQWHLIIQRGKRRHVIEVR